jgi:opine dehydrogenase
MHVLVLGSETQALAVAGVAARAGHDVALAKLTKTDALAPIARHGGLQVAGLLRNGFAAIDVVVDARHYADEADVIVVATRLREHPAVRSYLSESGARAGVILVPGGVGGSFAFGGLPTAFVAELPGFPLLADYDGEHTLTVRAVKRGLPVSVLPGGAGTKASSVLRDLGLDVSLTASVLETSLANTNVLIHPPLVLINWSRVETGSPFNFYREGLTSAGASLIDRVDAERQTVATAYGIAAVPLSQLLLRFYADQGMYGSNVAELLGTFPPFASTSGPNSPTHRYLTDDVPFGLVPLAALAGAAGIGVPTIDALIKVLCVLCDVDFRASGRSLKEMGLDGLDAAHIIAYARGEAPPVH